MNRFRTGLVVGKFAPLHLGHEHVIRAALAACDHVVLLSYSRPEFPGCEPARRAGWLAARFPQTTRIVLDHAVEPLPENTDSDDLHRAFCATILRRHFDRPIDAVFTSEAYGPGFAADLARRQISLVTHVAIDPARSTISVSGTALRADSHGLRRFLAPEVYATFVQRIALLGGESTGKSTLAVALAREFGTTYVAEYGRELWHARAGHFAFEDMLTIAREQIRREEKATLSSATCRYVFCDTTPLTTLFYSNEIFGRADPSLVSLASRYYDHTLLCSDDFAFVQDGTRRDASFRSHGQKFLESRLNLDITTVLTGCLDQRLARVKSALI